MSSPPTVNMTASLLAASGGFPDDFGVKSLAIWPSVMAEGGDEMVPDVSEELMAEVAAWMVVEVVVFGVTVVDETYHNKNKTKQKPKKKERERVTV